MKRLTFTRDHRLEQLADELVAAIPSLIATAADGHREALHRIWGDGATVTIEVPDDADEAAIAAIVADHTPRRAGLPPPADRVRPIVTGSRSDGTALASLLRRLAQAGLVEDHSRP